MRRHGRERARGVDVGGAARGEQRQQVEVERVALVMRGPLGMAAVGKDLPLDLVQQDPAAGRDPAFAARELGKRLFGLK